MADVINFLENVNIYLGDENLDVKYKMGYIVIGTTMERKNSNSKC